MGDVPIEKQICLEQSSLDSFLHKSPLTAREEKGHNWEIGNQDALDDAEIQHESNPRDPVEWKARIEKGVDHKVAIGSFNIGMEAKYSDAKIFPSWIERDWKPRFKNTHYAFNIFCINPEMKLKRQQIDELYNEYYRVMIRSEAMSFLSHIKDYVDRDVFSNLDKGMYANKVVQPTIRNSVIWMLSRVFKLVLRLIVRINRWKTAFNMLQNQLKSQLHLSPNILS